MFSNSFLLFSRPDLSVAAVVSIFLVAGSVLSGCGRDPARHRVETSLARTTLVNVLDSWKEGKKPGWWSTQSPSVIVQDVDWERGLLLVNYEFTADGEALDANFVCPVKMRLKDAEGNEKEINIAYLVGTSPVMTVFRQLNM